MWALPPDAQPLPGYPPSLVPLGVECPECASMLGPGPLSVWLAPVTADRWDAGWVLVTHPLCGSVLWCDLSSLLAVEWLSDATHRRAWLTYRLGCTTAPPAPGAWYETWGPRPTEPALWPPPLPPLRGRIVSPPPEPPPACTYRSADGAHHAALLVSRPPDEEGRRLIAIPLAGVGSPERAAQLDQLVPEARRASLTAGQIQALRTQAVLLLWASEGLEPGCYWPTRRGDP
jgi:hypothetical protein